MIKLKNTDARSATNVYQSSSNAHALDPAATLPVSRTVHAMEDLGAFVIDHRKAERHTQQELADLAGVGRRFLSELEAGKPTAEIGKVLQVLNALGIDLIVKSR